MLESSSAARHYHQQLQASIASTLTLSLSYLLAFCLIAYLLIHSLTHLLNYLLIYSLHSITYRLLTYSLACLRLYLLTCLLTYILTYLCTCLFAVLLTCLLVYSLTNEWWITLSSLFSIVPVLCSSPPQAGHSHVEVYYSTLVVGMIAVYTCDIGFYFSEGGTSRSIICLDGTWIQQAPECTGWFTTDRLK